MSEPFDRPFALVAAALLVGAAVGAGAVTLIDRGPRSGPGPGSGIGPDPVPPPGSNGTDGTAAPFAEDDPATLRPVESAAAFADYVRESRRLYADAPFVFRRVGFGGGRPVTLTATVTEGAPRRADAGAPGGPGDGPRHAGTNVQETGVDEPAAVETDGRYLYYSQPGLRARKHGANGTVFDVRTPSEPTVVGEVPADGRMLLDGDTLVVVGAERVTGYDVSTPADPAERWNRSVTGRVVTARLIDGRLYLVTREGIDVGDPCPVEPLGEAGPTVDCSRVYRHGDPLPAETTYTVVSLSAATGEDADAVSVVGTGRHTATYVSESAIYLSYTHRVPRATVLSTFLRTNDTVTLDAQARAELRRLASYNLSARARAVETRAILGRYYRRLPADRRDEARQRVRTTFRQYLTEHRRQLQTTKVAEVAIGGADADDGGADGDGRLSVAAVGEVPGRPLNQFSLDERDGRLRIATTVDGGPGESVNDLYVLDRSLNVTGSVTGMAPGQEVFAARFVGETAYLVTFRRVDPFHVVDLSEPTDPEELGQVKLPGFSRYLHPLGDGRIMGIGEEDGNVKAVIFDASDPTDPQVVHSRVLDARWSAVAETHHAFLRDPRHGVAFLPTESGGYVLSTENLSVVREVDTRGEATRATYVGDYMYVFDQGGLVVLDETDWSRVGRVDARP